MAKIIDLQKYKQKQEQDALKQEIDDMDYDMKYCLEHGVCDLCGSTSGDVHQVGNAWVCSCCTTEVCYE